MFNVSWRTSTFCAHWVATRSNLINELNLRVTVSISFNSTESLSQFPDVLKATELQAKAYEFCPRAVLRERTVHKDSIPAMIFKSMVTLVE